MWSSAFLSRGCAAALAIAALAAPATAAAAGPVPIEIGAANAPWDINNRGQIVGGGTIGFGTVVPAWLWKQGAGMTKLSGTPLAINDSAMVAGSESEFGGAFVWTPATGNVRLGLLGGEHWRIAWATDVNNRSEIVGKARDTLMTNPKDRAVKWTPEGFMVDLGTLPGTGTAMAEAINDNGDVVGTSGEQGSISFGGRAFLWTQASGMVDLGTLPGDQYSRATDINDSGQVIGVSRATNDSPGRGFLWTQAGGMVALDTLTGAPDSYAGGINDRGEIAGVTRGRPFVWSQATGLTLLDLLPGDTRGTATAINDRGEVVGVSSTDKTAHAVLWGGDPTAPSAKVRSARGLKLAGVRSRGLRLALTLSEPGTTDITLTRGKQKLATKTVTATNAGTRAVTFKLDRKVRVGLRKLNKATFVVRTAARDLAGNSSITTTKLTIKR